MSYGFFSLSPLMDCYFYTSANGERQWAVYASWFFYIISINGLLLLHFCKWRNGHVAVYSSLFFSSSPLTDCYFYTSANGERAYSRVRLIDFLSLSPLIDFHFYTSTNGERTYSRVRLMIFLHCLYWWITTSTLLQMENGHVTVYALLVFLHYLH